MLEIERNGFCSPIVSDDNPTCFDDKHLKIIIDAYNRSHPDRINRNVKGKYKAINNKLKKIVGDKKHWLWCDYLAMRSRNDVMIKKLKEIADERLLPAQPKSWKKNKYEWFSNFDLENLLVKYHDSKKHKYHFIGVKNHDFGVKNNDGTCLVDHDCNVNINSIIKSGKHFIGIIIYKTYHWRSLYVVLLPEYKAYGVYYYDSVGTSMPKELKIYTDMVIEQLTKRFKKKPIFYENKYDMQKSSYACGSFQATFQIKFTEMLLKKKSTTFEDFVKLNPNDNDVWKYRDLLYRETM